MEKTEMMKEFQAKTGIKAMVMVKNGMEVFSLKRFLRDRRIPIRKLLASLFSGWPQACNGVPVEELRHRYSIMPEWIENK